MAPRCSGSAQFLPFLYPSLFLRQSTSLLRLSHLASRFQSTSADAEVVERRSRLNPSPDDFSTPYFADKTKLMLYAGHGGDGCISFLRDIHLDEGPANGGDGGHGGNIYIQAVHGETSLHKLSRRRFVRAERGKHGQGRSRGGTRGEDVVITVPVGTVVKELSRQDPEAERDLLAAGRRRRRRPQAPTASSDSESTTSATQEEASDDPDRHKWLLYPGISSTEAKRVILPRLPRRNRLYAQPVAPIHLDLSRPTPQPLLLAAGAIGGLGNPHFVSRDFPRPLFATRGNQAIAMEIELELRLLADVGLVGLPNAGKSTLLRALSNSRARVGHWAFTTLQPNIGTVVLDNNKGRPLVTSYRQPDDDPFALEAEPERRTRFTVADIPGLIEGAHLDKGLGVAFLRHVERAGVLAFVVDLSAGDAVEALKALWKEVGLYSRMREEEENDRKRESRIDWSFGAGADDASPWERLGSATVAERPPPPKSQGGLHIAAKPWFVIATKGDLPGAQENFGRLREYLAAVTRGDALHPSGVETGWTKDCVAIPVSAINGHGVDRIIHWTVGLLDG